MRTLPTILMLALATPAIAREPDRTAAPSASAAVPAIDPASPWSASVQGGGLIADGNGDQTYASAGLSRDIGDRLTLGIAGSYTDGRDAGDGLLALPSKTYEARVSADAAFGPVSVGGYASYGRRTFSTASFTRRNGAVVDVGGSGPVFGVGASVSYDLQLNDALYLSPQATVAYDQADIARVFAAEGGVRAVKDGEHGVTGTFGLALDRFFGASGIGVSAAFATSSNAAAYRSGSGQAPVSTALGGKRADNWVELGATGSLALNPRLALTLSALRTLGFADDDGTTVVGGIRARF